MNRIISLLLALSMVLGICGCAAVPSEPTVEPDPGVSTEPLQSPSEPVAPPPPSEPDDVIPEEEPPVPEEPAVEEEPEEYIRVVDPYKPMVALTFDDGPHEEFSPRILDVLEANHSVATFFEVGYNARRHPEILKRMAELGCEIGSHSNAHHDLTTLSKDALLTDLAKLDKIILDATGTAPTLVRPPYGAVNRNVKSGTGRAMITWTVDTNDWQYRNADHLINYIQSYGDLDGEIVLMHSIHGSTAEAMEVLVPWLIEQGYQLVTVSELMAYYYGELLEPNKFYNQTYFARHDRTEYPLELPDEPMETQIPEYTTVPVVPMTPEDAPAEQPPQQPEPALPEEPAAPDVPPAGDDTQETPPEDGTTQPGESPEDSTETDPPLVPAEPETPTPPASSEENADPSTDTGTTPDGSPSDTPIIEALPTP